MSSKRPRLDADVSAATSPPDTPAWAHSLQAQLAALATELAASRMEAREHMAQLGARLATLERAVDAGHRALPAAYRGCVALAKRTLLSPAEEVLAIPFLSQRSVLSFLAQKDARPLRAASRACRDAVAEHAWGAEPRWDSPIKGSLASWRRSFPRAAFALLHWNLRLTDDDMVHLRGIHTLKMNLGLGSRITDAGLVHLSGIHTLSIYQNSGILGSRASITDAGLAGLLRTRGWPTCAAFMS